MGSCSGSLNSGLTEFGTAKTEFQVMVRARSPDEEPWQKIYEAELAYYRAHPQRASVLFTPPSDNQIIQQMAAAKTKYLQQQLRHLFSYFDNNQSGVLSPNDLSRMMKAGSSVGKRVAAPMMEMLLELAWDGVADLMISPHAVELVTSHQRSERGGTSKEEMEHIMKIMKPDFKGRDCFMIRFTRRIALKQFQQCMANGYCAELVQCIEPEREGTGVTKQQFIDGLVAFDMQRIAKINEGATGLPVNYKMNSSEEKEFSEEIKSKITALTHDDSTKSNNQFDKKDRNMYTQVVVATPSQPSGLQKPSAVVVASPSQPASELEKPASELVPASSPPLACGVSQDQENHANQCELTREYWGLFSDKKAGGSADDESWFESQGRGCCGW